MLEVNGLRKSYGDLAAVNGVSLRAGKGETIGLLGPNGAGGKGENIYLVRFHYVS